MKKFITIAVLIAAAMFSLGYGVSSLKENKNNTVKKNEKINESTINHEDVSSQGAAQEKSTLKTGNADTIKDCPNEMAEKNDGKSESDTDTSLTQEPSESLLPGHNTYFNGFERKTKLSYDDVASVTDSTYIFTIGTYYNEGYFQESIESQDSNDSTLIMNGCKIKWQNVHYKDIDISYTTYNPITNDFSGENYYIGKIILNDARFQTSEGIHVGSTIDEMFAAYNADNYENIDTTIYRNSEGEPYYRLTVDGVTLIFYFDESTKVITRIKLGY